MRALIVLFAILSGVYSASALSATTYYWAIVSCSNVNKCDATSVGPTLEAACAAAWKGASGYTRNESVILSNGVSGQCYYTVDSSGVKAWYNGTRKGDSCPSGQVLNATTGGCETPAGEDYTFCNNTNADSDNPKIWLSGVCTDLWTTYDKAVYCKYFSKVNGGSTGHSQISVDFDTADPGPVNGTSVAANESGCEVLVATSQCTVNPDGKGSHCLVTGTYTGNLGGGTGNPKDEDCHTNGGCAAPDLTPKTDTNNQPCNYSAGSDGSQSCTSKQETKTSGSQNCGTANGVFSCDWKSPTSKGIDIATNISTTTNADGSTTSVKTDVSTKTVCTDMNVCTSSTTTTKTTTTKDGSGVVTSTQSTCSGAACGTGSASNGSGTGSGGTGEGEGGGDCVTADECSDGSSPDTPKLDNVDDYQTTTQKFYDTVKSSPIATAVGNISAPDTGTAPTLTTPALQALGGASLDYGIIRDLKSTLDDVMQPTMKAFWCFVAVMIFLLA